MHFKSFEFEVISQKSQIVKHLLIQIMLHNLTIFKNTGQGRSTLATLSTFKPIFRVLDFLSKFREGDQIELNLFHHQKFYLIKSLI